jgi:Tol biopolymer transport system component
VDPDHNVSRPAWAPDGQAILVVSNDTVDQQQVELLEYTSAKPSSGKPPDWNDQGLVTDGMHGKKPGDEVVAAAWSPDGTQVAVTANWRTGVAQLYLVQSQQDQLGKAKSVPGVRGCEVSWRSDGAELALTQRDALCDQPGVIVRIDPATPKEAVTLTKLGAENPTWSPVPPEG